MEKKKTEKIKNKKIRVKGYERKGKRVKGHPKWVDKYPRRYRTFRRINGIVRFVEVTRTGNKYSVKILDGRVGQPVRAGVLEINQSGKTKHFLPNKKFMKRELYKQEIEAFMKLAESSDEKSFALDFERYLNNPERIAITKGGYSSTMKIDDFELFGHSHPLDSKNQKMPSISDLRNMKLLYPEFLIAYDKYGLEKTTEMYFFLIEDVEKYDAWTTRKAHNDPKKEHPISDFELSSEKAKLKAFEKNGKKKGKIDLITMDNLFESEEGRTIFYNLTGVKIYSYDPTIYGVKLELPDDPKREYALIPRTSKENLKEWTWRSEPFYNAEQTNEIIRNEKRRIEEKYRNKAQPSREQQLNDSLELLSFLGEKQKSYRLDNKELDKAIAIEVERCKKLRDEQFHQELNFLHEAFASEEKKESSQKTNNMPLSSRDQTVRWMSLSKEQLNTELNDINRYPTVEALKEASESLLTRQEKNLKTRKRLVEIIEKKIAEDRAISHLGR